MKRKTYQRNRGFMPGFKQKSIKKRKVLIMDTNDRKVMTKDLISLGLNEDLLSNLSDDVISQLFQLIGWASNVEIITGDKDKDALLEDERAAQDGEPTTADEHNKKWLDEKKEK